MPEVRIISQTAAAESEPFTVRGPDLPLGVRSWGLSGTEEIAIHEDRGDGVFRALTETDSILSATNQDTSILASGRYKLVKPITASPSGASTD